MVGGWGYGFAHLDVGEAMLDEFRVHPLFPFIQSGTVAHG